MNLIRDIDKDNIKQFLCKAMVGFCKNTGILLIAEGIETEEELKTLIKLNVDLGQGYFLGIPQHAFFDIVPEKMAIIYQSSGDFSNDIVQQRKNKKRQTGNNYEMLSQKFLSCYSSFRCLF